MNTQDPFTAEEFAELRRNDKWTTPRLILTVLVTLTCAFTFLYFISS